MELEGPPGENYEAVEQIVRHMAASDVGYGGINYPLMNAVTAAIVGLCMTAVPAAAALMYAVFAALQVICLQMSALTALNRLNCATANHTTNRIIGGKNNEA